MVKDHGGKRKVAIDFLRVGNINFIAMMQLFKETFISKYCDLEVPFKSHLKEKVLVEK
jgi:hypothetical protein